MSNVIKTRPGGYEGRKDNIMNNTRRKTIQKIIDDLNDFRNTLDDVYDEEETYRDSIPENMQGGERYEKADEACDNISDALNDLEEVISSLETAIE